MVGGLLTKTRQENEEVASKMDPAGEVAETTTKTMSDVGYERLAKEVVGYSIPSAQRVGLTECAILLALIGVRVSGGCPWVKSGSLEASVLLNEDDLFHDGSSHIQGLLGGTRPRATRLALECILVPVHVPTMIRLREPRAPLLSSPDAS